jgi:hypothetical protein
MKIDFRKEYKSLYGAPTGNPVMVDVPDLSFLMIDGIGDPNTSAEYREALEALYALSYSAKFAVKKGAEAVDFAVMPLEGLWWTEDMTKFSPDRKDMWQWTAMIMQPQCVTAAIYDDVLTQVTRKKSVVSLSKVRFEHFREGPCAQIMHVGPYAAEGPTIERLHAFISDQGRQIRGKHHEIYLGDPRRSAPANLKTVVRQPVT